MKRERWRFVDQSSARPEARVIEVEAEPTSGFNLTLGETWRGTLVKARHPLLRDRRWHRANLIGEPFDGDEWREAVELVALAVLHPRAVLTDEGRRAAWDEARVAFSEGRSIFDPEGLEP